MLFNNLRMGFPLGLAGAASASNLITNGGFDTDTAWTKGAGWTIAGGVAVGTATAEQLRQDPGIFLGIQYRVSYDLTITAGDCHVFVRFGDFAGIARTTSGSYSEDFTAGSNDDGGVLGFGKKNEATFTGTIDNVSLIQI